MNKARAPARPPVRPACYDPSVPGASGKRWVEAGVDEERAVVLAAALRLHPLAARVLAARGHANPAAAEAFLSARLANLPDPFAMKGMEAAVARIARALEAGERIACYGDYDVDGVTSTALLCGFLRLRL